MTKLLGGVSKIAFLGTFLGVFLDRTMRSNGEMIRRSTIVFIVFLAYLIKISGFFSMFDLENVLFAPLSLLVGGV